MSEHEIKTVKTSRGELRYYRDWNNSEGGVVMLNPQTINRYIEIRSFHPNIERYACFFAFGNEQFDKNLAAAIGAGRIKEGEKLYYHPSISGLHGTAEGIAAFVKAYADRDATIPVECDPQEVYFYEYNNHESMYAWDGDLDAVRLVMGHFGVDAARSLVRFSAGLSVDQILERDNKC